MPFFNNAGCVFAILFRNDISSYLVDLFYKSCKNIVCHRTAGLILCLVLVSVYPKFAVDGMLGKIAKKLRMFGFDTLYFADTDDNAIINICLDEKRCFFNKRQGTLQKIS